MARAASIRRVGSANPRTVLGKSQEQLWTTNAKDAEPCYGAGFIVASEIGIDGLHALCIRARDEGVEQVPLDWFFAASGLSDTDMRKWPIRGKGPLPSAYFEREPE
jgi:hypothetical protein